MVQILCQTAKIPISQKADIIHINDFNNGTLRVFKGSVKYSDVECERVSKTCPLLDLL